MTCLFRVDCYVSFRGRVSLTRTQVFIEEGNETTMHKKNKNTHDFVRDIVDRLVGINNFHHKVKKRCKVRNIRHDGGESQSSVLPQTQVFLSLTAFGNFSNLHDAAYSRLNCHLEVKVFARGSSQGFFPS